MGFFAKLFGTAKEEVEMKEMVDETEVMADEAATPTCTCTPDKKCEVCAAKEAAAEATDMDENNLD